MKPASFIRSGVLAAFDLLAASLALSTGSGGGSAPGELSADRLPASVEAGGPD